MYRNAETTNPPANLFPRDIPRMPDRYYSGDNPNPSRSAFVGQHLREKSYDPAIDTHDVPAFHKPIGSTNGRSPRKAKP